LVDGVMPLPASLGTGHLQLLEPEPGLKLAILDCALMQEFTLKRLAETTGPETLFFSFNAFDPVPNATTHHLSSVQITSSGISITTTLPAQTAIFAVAIAIEKALLLQWLNPTDEVLPSFLVVQKPVVLDTLITPSIQQVMVQFAELRPLHFLDSFFYRIRVQELLYLLFLELAKRTEVPVRHLHTADAEKIFQVRAALLASLSTPPPSLAELAHAAGLSETKMKQLFRQVFGASVYEYYQIARMEEAKCLLPHFSVAEVGYQLGFTNLSHFARLFEKHHQLTPKKYQTMYLR